MIKNKDELEFAIFCIENIAQKLNKPAESVYLDLSKESDILDNYIVAHYNVLHTQDKNYIVDDIVRVMEIKGVLR